MGNPGWAIWGASRGGVKGDSGSKTSHVAQRSAKENYTSNAMFTRVIRQSNSLSRYKLDKRNFQ